MIDKEKLQ